MQNSHQVILDGGFNSILNQNEKVGGIFPPLKTIQDFLQFVENNDLVDIQSSNSKFTLMNKRFGLAQIVIHLDRFLLSHYWKLGNYHIQSDIFPILESDHFQIFLNINQLVSLDQIQHKRSFMFERMWL